MEDGSSPVYLLDENCQGHTGTLVTSSTTNIPSSPQKRPPQRRQPACVERITIEYDETRYMSLPFLSNNSFQSEDIAVSCRSDPSINTASKASKSAARRALLSQFVDRDTNSCAEKLQITQHRPVKNLCVLSIGWMFFFMAFFSMRSLQSSMNHGGGLGLASLACIYAGLLLACFFTIPIVKHLGTKRTLIAGLLCHILYVACNIYPTFYTMIPSSFMAGFSQALMWTAQGSYLIKLSTFGSLKTSKPLKSTASTYFGVFFLFYSLSTVFGSLMSSFLMKHTVNRYDHWISNETNYPLPVDSYAESYIGLVNSQKMNGSQAASLFSLPLDVDRTNVNNMIDYSVSAFRRMSAIGGSMSNRTDTNDVISSDDYTSREFNDDVAVSCGAMFCHDRVDNDVIFILPLETRVIIITSFIICMVLGLFIFALLLDEKRQRQPALEWSKLLSQLKALVVFLKNPKFHFLAPLIFYLGIQTSFYSSEITKAYVTCMLGMEMVGFSMACFGCSAAVSSYLTGYIKQFVSRVTILFFGFLIDLGCLLAMGLWSPAGHNTAGVFALISLWGFADGIWMTHVNCLTGLLFPESIEAAFAAFQSVIALGLVVGYSTSQYLCMTPKIYAVGVCAVTGMSSFLILKVKVRREKRTMS